MVVHIGVIVIAVALAASNSFTHSATLDLSQGDVVEWGGHTFELVSVDERTNDRESRIAANVILDGAKTYRPAITTYLNMGADIGTPSVRTGFTEDIYLTLGQGAAPGDTSVTIRVFVKPMILWLWIGGAIMAVGTMLAAFPGTRRRLAIDPVSAPIATGGPPSDNGTDDTPDRTSDNATDDASDDDQHTRTGASV
jgi:cytochrome c-type biogenesis protein CcmF